jgi:hypothetical protein
MKEICCHTCAYLIIMDPDKTRLFEQKNDVITDYENYFEKTSQTPW